MVVCADFGVFNVVIGRKLTTRRLTAADVVEVVEGREGVEGIVVDCVDESWTIFGRVEAIQTGKHAGKDEGTQHEFYRNQRSRWLSVWVGTGQRRVLKAIESVTISCLAYPKGGVGVPTPDPRSNRSPRFLASPVVAQVNPSRGPRQGTPEFVAEDVGDVVEALAASRGAPRSKTCAAAAVGDVVGL